MSVIMKAMVERSPKQRFMLKYLATIHYMVGRLADGDILKAHIGLKMSCSCHLRTSDTL